jgi:hypothetical protein
MSKAAKLQTGQPREKGARRCQCEPQAISPAHLDHTPHLFKEHQETRKREESWYQYVPLGVTFQVQPKLAEILRPSARKIEFEAFTWEIPVGVQSFGGSDVE